MDLLTQENVIPQSHPDTGPRFLIGIRMNNGDKSELFNPGLLKLRVGTSVMVETDQGPRPGVVASNKVLNFTKDRSKTFRKVLRIFNENDIQGRSRIQDLERRALDLCAEKIKELKLPMNLSRVVHLAEMNKTVFYFTAEGRVDFRQLIKALASKLRHRIEMKQVGVRDEARAIGGYGICGESLCCSTFLKEFTPVTIRMAKDQGLALNPTKISGVCGRLMCCLQYEHANYKDLIKGMPKVNSRINTADGPGKVLKNDILQQKILVRLEDESIITYHLNELEGYLTPKNPGPSSKNQN